MKNEDWYIAIGFTIMMVLVGLNIDSLIVQ